MSRRLALLPLALIAARAQPTAAADAAREACGSRNPERVLAGCGEILDRGGRESFDGRARAHFNRGEALRLTGEREPASRYHRPQSAPCASSSSRARTATSSSSESARRPSRSRLPVLTRMG